MIRVTECLSIIKTGLSTYLDEFGIEAEFKVKEKAFLGRQVHELISSYVLDIINGTKTTIIAENFDPMAFEYFASFKKWSTDTVEEYYASEFHVVNKVFGYEGTLDLLVRIKGDTFPSVIDVKTPATAVPSWFIQVEAYRRAINTMDVFPEAKRAFALMLSPTGAKAKEITLNQDYLYRLFLYCLELRTYFK